MVGDKIKIRQEHTDTITVITDCGYKTKQSVTLTSYNSATMMTTGQSYHIRSSVTPLYAHKLLQRGNT